MTDLPPPMPDPEAEAAGSVPIVPGYVLANVGVPITVARLTNGQREYGGSLPEDQREPLTRNVHLRIRAKDVVALESVFDGFTTSEPKVAVEVALGDDGRPLVGPAGPVTTQTIVGHYKAEWYGQEAFQKAMEKKPLTALQAVFVTCLGLSEADAAEAILESEVLDYQVALSTAWSLAMGVDPTSAARILQEGRAGLQKAMVAMGDQISEAVAGLAQAANLDPTGTA